MATKQDKAAGASKPATPRKRRAKATAKKDAAGVPNMFDGAQAALAAACKWPIRIIRIAMVDPRSLLDHPDNWRLHPEYQKRVMEGSLDELGWIQFVTVSDRTGLIIDGHMRVHMAIDHDEPLVPVAYLDMKPEDERKALASIDTVPVFADFDFEAMQRNLSKIDTTNEAFAGMFDDLMEDAEGAISSSKKMEEEGSSNFGSIKKAFKDRKIPIRAVFAIDDAETVELAIRATGKINRAEALVVIAQAYIDDHIEDEDDDSQTGQHVSGAQDEPATGVDALFA